MEITNYKKKNSNLYEVKFSNGEVLKLYDDIILKYELLIDKNISEKKYQEIVLENSFLDAYYKALKYISTKMRTDKEIRAFLKRYDMTGYEVDYAIDKLKKEGYIDEKMYTKAYINDEITLSLNGPKKILNNLLKLGISKNIIDEYLQEVDIKIWQARIKKIIDKRSKGNRLGLNLFKNKMYSHLIGLGYYSDDIKEVLDNYTLDTKDAFINEADKAWRLFKNKYDEKTAVLKFKNKMYSKGFSLDEINSYIEFKD